VVVVLVVGLGGVGCGMRRSQGEGSAGGCGERLGQVRRGVGVGGAAGEGRRGAAGEPEGSDLRERGGGCVGLGGVGGRGRSRLGGVWGTDKV